MSARHDIPAALAIVALAAVIVTQAMHAAADLPQAMAHADTTIHEACMTLAQDAPPFCAPIREESR